MKVELSRFITEDLYTNKVSFCQSLTVLINRYLVLNNQTITAIWTYEQLCLVEFWNAPKFYSCTWVKYFLMFWIFLILQEQFVAYHSSSYRRRNWCCKPFRYPGISPLKRQKSSSILQRFHEDSDLHKVHWRLQLCQWCEHQSCFLRWMCPPAGERWRCVSVYVWIQ